MNKPLGMWRAAALAVILFAVAFTLTFVARHWASSATSAPASLTGRRAPLFAVRTNRGEFSLANDRRPVLLELFATWCGHCKNEVATIDKLHKKYAKDVAFIAVSGSRYGIDGTSRESLADVRRFARRLKAQYRVAYNPSLTVNRDYNGGGFPTVVLIDRAKHVVFQSVGEVPYKVLDAQIAALGCATSSSCQRP